MNTFETEIDLLHRHQLNGLKGRENSYSVKLDKTQCHYGGERIWFLCPADGCGRRVAVLYYDQIFTCRHCAKLIYASQNQKPIVNEIMKADKIRARLQWTKGIRSGIGSKPKGMHLKTFMRLKNEHHAIVKKAFLYLDGHQEKLNQLMMALGLDDL